MRFFLHFVQLVVCCSSVSGSETFLVEFCWLSPMLGYEEHLLRCRGAESLQCQPPRMTIDMVAEGPWQTGICGARCSGINADLNCKGCSYGALSGGGYINQGSVRERESGNARQKKGRKEDDR